MAELKPLPPGVDGAVLCAHSVPGWRRQLLARAFSVIFSSHACTVTLSTAFLASRSQTS